MNYGQKLKLGDAHATPRNIQEVQASKLGDAPKHPHFSSPKYQVISQCASLFIASYNMCYSWSVFIFVFSFVLFCFVLFSVINGWTPSYLFWRETRSVLIAQNTLVFTHMFNERSIFASTAFSFSFSLKFCSEIVSFLCFNICSSLIFYHLCLLNCFK